MQLGVGDAPTGRGGRGSLGWVVANGTSPPTHTATHAQGAKVDLRTRQMVEEAWPPIPPRLKPGGGGQRVWPTSHPGYTGGQQGLKNTCQKNRGNFLNHGTPPPPTASPPGAGPVLKRSVILPRLLYKANGGSARPTQKVSGVSPPPPRGHEDQKVGSKKIRKKGSNKYFPRSESPCGDACSRMEMMQTE